MSLSVYIECSRPGRIEGSREVWPEDSICYELFDFNLGFLSWCVLCVHLVLVRAISVAALYIIVYCGSDSG